MRSFSFLSFIFIFVSVAYAQDKTNAKEFDQIDDDFIQKVRQIARDKPDAVQNSLNAGYSISEVDSTRIKIEQRLESEKDNRKYFHELPYWGLNGKIKKITISRYLAGKDSSKTIVRRTNNGKVPVTTNYQRVTFDENGYPSDYLETTITRGVSKTITRQSRYIGPQLFEEVEYNETGANFKKFMGRRKEFDVFFRERNHAKNGEINIFYKEKKQLVYNNYLDDKGNNIVETKYYKKNLPIATEQKIAGVLNYKSHTKYNSDNTVREITQIIVDTKPFTRHFKYTEKDSHNNWTERVCYNSDKKPMWLEIAEYEYEDTELDTDVLSSDSISTVQEENIELIDSTSSEENNK